MAKANRVALQLRLDETLYEKAKAISGTELRTLNAQFEYFIKHGIEQYEKEHGEVEIPEAE